MSSAPASNHTLNFEGIGTHWQIDIHQPLSSAALARLGQSIQDRVSLYDQTYSRFRSDSVIDRLSRGSDSVILPDDATALFDFYQQLYDITSGRVTPLIGNVLADAGYDAGYSLKPKSVVAAAPRWEDTLRYQHPKLSVTKPVIIDVGAAGKGHLVDIVGQLLQNANVDNFVIDASGDMLHRSPNSRAPLRVGLEHPNDSSMVIGVVEIANQSICCSASNRRAWGNFHHIMDPISATPVRNIISVWTLADTAMLADGLATALFFTPGKKLQQRFSFEYFAVHSDLSYTHSAGWPMTEIFGAVT